MKKSFFVVLLLGSVFMFSLTSCGKDDDMDTDEEIILDETPEVIQTYVNTHFPDNAILKVVKELDDGVVTFEVSLAGNVELEFNEAKEIIEIESNTKLPDSVIPVKIRDYVQANYSNSVITDWELSQTGQEQEVELDDGVELVFNLAGDFLRVDD